MYERKTLEELDKIEQVLMLVQVNHRTDLAKAKVQLVLCGRKIAALEDYIRLYASHGTRRERILNRLCVARRHILVALQEITHERLRRQQAQAQRQRLDEWLEAG